MTLSAAKESGRVCCLCDDPTGETVALYRSTSDSRYPLRAHAACRLAAQQAIHRDRIRETGS